MDANSFFATPPKAECAFLSAYGSETLSGRFGIRIETEPLLFADPDLDRELEPFLLLDYLPLPSLDPAELANTRHIPDRNYEGSFYFLGEHNWVDLNEVRFLDASANSILAEYDLAIHLPTTPPNRYLLTLRVPTEIQNGDPPLESPRSVGGLGTLQQDEENSWKGRVCYDNCDVEIELSADAASFEQIAAYARSVVAENSLPRSKLDKEIENGLQRLADKLRRFNVSPDFTAADFVPFQFYFYKRRHHDQPEMIIGLRHPTDGGHWSIKFSDLDYGYLNWVPKD